VDEGLGRKAIKTHEYVNHAAVGQNVLVADRVELPVERHRAPAIGAIRNFILLEKIGFAAGFVALPDFSAKGILARPFEAGCGFGSIVHWLGHQTEGRDLDGHLGTPVWFNGELCSASHRS
jgi:hypothetical protein